MILWVYLQGTISFSSGESDLQTRQKRTDRFDSSDGRAPALQAGGDFRFESRPGSTTF